MGRAFMSSKKSYFLDEIHSIGTRVVTGNGMGGGGGAGG